MQDVLKLKKNNNSGAEKLRWILNKEDVGMWSGLVLRRDWRLFYQIPNYAVLIQWLMVSFPITTIYINLLAPKLFFLILAHLYIKCE